MTGAEDAAPGWDAITGTLEEVGSAYAVPLRMGAGVSDQAERELHALLAKLQEQLGSSPIVDRRLATLLLELVVASEATLTRYSGEELRRAQESVATVGEAVLAVLTPSEMPPLPR